jgi:hypothetical protein
MRKSIPLKIWNIIMINNSNSENQKWEYGYRDMLSWLPLSNLIYKKYVLWYFVIKIGINVTKYINNIENM